MRTTSTPAVQVQSLLFCCVLPQYNLTEAFYKAEFMGALKGSTSSEAERRQMLETLRRFESQQIDSDDDDDVADAEEALAGLDLDSEEGLKIAWGMLSDEQRREFSRQLDQGLVSIDVAPWTPWWSAIPKPLVTDVAAKPLALERAPKPLDGVPELSALLGQKQPAAELVMNLVDLLFSYAFTARFYNGEVADPEHEVSTLLAASAVLGRSAVHSDPVTAIQDCWSRIQTTQALQGSAAHAIVAIHDTVELLSHPLQVTCALSEMHQWIESAKATQRISKEKASKAESSKMTAVSKKLLFMISWWTWLSTQQSRETIGLVAALVDGEHKRMAEEFRQVATTTTALSKERAAKASKKPLIQEI